MIKNPLNNIKYKFLLIILQIIFGQPTYIDNINWRCSTRQQATSSNPQGLHVNHCQSQIWQLLATVSQEC